MKRNLLILLLITLLISMISMGTVSAYTASDITTYTNAIANDPQNFYNYRQLAAAMNSQGSNEIQIFVDGQFIVSSIYGKNGSTECATMLYGQVYTPIRPVAERLGGSFSQTSNIVTLSNAKNGGTLVFTLPTSGNTEEYQMVSPVKYNGSIVSSYTVLYRNWRIYVPVGFIKSYLAATAQTATSGSVSIVQILRNQSPTDKEPAPPAQPQISQNGTNPVYVTMSTSTSGATIYYTTNGSTPDTGSNYYGGQFSVTSSTTITARAYKDGLWSSPATLVINVNNTPPAQPQISQSGTNPVTVTITSPDGSPLYYTTNGSTPTTSNPYYSPFQVSTTTTVMAMAYKNNQWSAPAVLVINVNNTPPATPVITTNGTNPVYVTITSPDGSPIYYTTNGSTPNTSSTQYYSAIPVTTSTTIIAMAYKNNMWSAPATLYVTVNNTPPATPVITTNGTNPVYVTITSPDGSPIYYTTNGSTPNTSSTQYYSAIPVTTSTTIIAMAYKNNMWSAPATLYVTVNNTPPATPVITTNGTNPVYVTITSPDGSPIYYTTNGSTPNTSSTQYYSAIPVTTSTTIIAMAYKNNQWSSPATLYVTVNSTPATPVITQSGTYPVYVTITSPDGSPIYYTTNGSTPNTSSNYYSGQFTVTSSTTIIAMGYRNNQWSSPAVLYVTVNGGGNITAPTMSPQGGTFSTGVYVTLSNNGTGTIYYTKDGSDPTVYSPTCTNGGQVYVDSNVTLLAKTIYNGSPSSVVMGVFYINTNTAPNQPTCYPSSGTYSTTQTVTITSPDGGTIYYTTDGNDPNTSSPTYYSAVTVDRSLTLKARAYKNGLFSTVMRADYEINNIPSMPIANPYAGTLSQARYITLTCVNATTIYYTLDGNEPTTSSPSVSSGGTVYVDKTLTLRAKGYKNGNFGPTLVAAYYINTYVAKPTISPAPGTYSSYQWITLTGESGAIVRYTTDGSEPTTSSPQFVYSIKIDTSTTVKAKAYKGSAYSDTLTAVYTIGSLPPAQEDSDARLAEARRLFNLGKYNESIVICEELLNDDPDMQDAIILEANNYVKKGDTTKAKSLLKQFIAVYEFPRVINRYAEVCIARGEATEGRRAVLDIIQEYPNETYLYKTITYANNKLRNTDIMVYVYGKQVDFVPYDNIKPMIVEGRTLIPIRALTEAMGAYVDWDQYQKKATISLDGNTIVLLAYNNIATVNGVRVKLDIPAQIVDNARMLVPLRFVAENLGKTVDWYEVEAARTVSITDYNELSANSVPYVKQQY